MYLLSVTTLPLHSFIGEAIPPYAILSHVWGSEEVSYVSMAKPKHRAIAEQQSGFRKIEMCCKQAQRDGYHWVWVDTCCIDKRSSAELSEAINSMFVWYSRAACCYVYLFDVDVVSTPSSDWGEASSDGGEDEATGLRGFGDSRWFTRGWTLQELLAPRKLEFFARDWTPIGYMANHRYGGKKTLHNSVPNGLADTDKSPPPLESQREMARRNEKAYRSLSHPYLDLASQISLATQIPADYLIGTKALRQACVAQRMFWASRRKTTREEDRAYSLMGLFDINMPILYGEGLEKAFTRLQHEIMLKSPDQSILMWYKTGETSYRLLAESPDYFWNSGDVVLMSYADMRRVGREQSLWSSFTMTNLGLRITLPIVWLTGRSDVDTRAVLNCAVYDVNESFKMAGLNLLFLQKDLEGYPVYSCHRPPNWITVTGDVTFMATRMHLCGNGYVSSTAESTPISSEMAAGLRSKPKSLDLEIFEILARAADVSVDNLTGETKIEDLGIDSLMALAVFGELREAFGTLVPVTTFLEFPDIESLCSYYRRELSV